VPQSHILKKVNAPLEHPTKAERNTWQWRDNGSRLWLKSWHSAWDPNERRE